MTKMRSNLAAAVLFTGVLAAICVGCAMFSRVSPAQTAADALAAEDAAHKAAIAACAAYESALVARVVRPDADVSGHCAALRE